MYTDHQAWRIVSSWQWYGDCRPWPMLVVVNLVRHAGVPWSAICGIARDEQPNEWKRTAGRSPSVNVLLPSPSCVMVGVHCCRCMFVVCILAGVCFHLNCVGSPNRLRQDEKAKKDFFSRISTESTNERRNNNNRNKQNTARGRRRTNKNKQNR